MMTAQGATMPIPDKSTNVRSKHLARPDVRWASFQVLSRVAPGLAGRLASKLFLTPPPPRPLSGRMTNQLERASDRFTVALKTSFGGIHEECRLNVALWGQGPAVYLLHGWGGRGSQWVSFVDPLVEAGFTAVVLDAPMHGESPAPRTSILHFAAALSAVVDSLGPARVVVGHSLGAAACSLALQDGLGAAGVVLVGAPADPATFFSTFLSRLGIGENLHRSVRSYVEQCYGFSWNDLKIRPPSHTTAALVVHDRNDLEVAYDNAERIVDAWPAAELFETSGLGHQRILRDDRVARRVVDFASQIAS
jgi:pimeloyl-ACP methyl ester carboxylesterase